MAALFTSVGSLQAFILLGVFVCSYVAFGLCIATISHWRATPPWRAWALRGGTLVTVVVIILGIRWLAAPALMNTTLTIPGAATLFSPWGAMRANDGTLLWQQDLGDTPPAIANGIAYSLIDDSVQAVRVTDGSVL